MAHYPLYTQNLSLVGVCVKRIGKVQITDPKVVAAGESGVEIEVSELHREFRSLEPDNAVQELAEIFALYLKDYRDVSIFYEGQRIDPSVAIAATETVSLCDIDDDGVTHPAELEIIEWRTMTTRALYLCTERGFPLSKVACLSGYHPHPLYVVCLLGLQARAGAGALRRRSG